MSKMLNKVSTTFRQHNAFICEYLHMVRLSNQMTLSDVSKLTNIVHATISSFENCSRGYSLKLIYALCDAYGLMPSTVFIFAEAAATVGLEKAYELEAPNLVNVRKEYYQKKVKPCPPEIQYAPLSLIG